VKNRHALNLWAAQVAKEKRNANFLDVMTDATNGEEGEALIRDTTPSILKTPTSSPSRRPCLSSPQVSRKEGKQRSLIASEILSSEKAFLNGLQTLKNVFFLKFH
jgi:hypothetical protein